MKITLATLGSLGDLHPFIAVARRLAAHGYEPVIASLPEYRERMQEAGVAFHPVRPSRQDILRDLGIDMAELARRAMTDVGFIFRDAVFPYLEAAYHDLLPLVRDSALVLSHSLAYSARIAAEVAHVPHVTMVLRRIPSCSRMPPRSSITAGSARSRRRCARASRS